MSASGRGDRCLGVVLRTTPVRESDLIVQLYTDTKGKVSAIARGGRRSQRRFAGALQLLVLGRFQLVPGRGELWTLESAEIEREWTRLAGDVVAVAHASYVAELVAALLPPETPDPGVLDLVCAAWETMATTGPSAGALRGIEFALLDLAGHRPAIDRCAACGRDPQGGPEGEVTVFDPSRGGAICRSCAATSRGPGVRPFPEGARAYLSAIAEADDPQEAAAVDARFLAEDRVAAREAMIAMVTGLVGRPLRSLEYLQKLVAAGRRPAS